MRGDASRLSIRKSTVNVPEELDLLKEILIALKIYQDGRTLSIFGQDDRTLGLLHLAKQLRGPGLQLGNRLGIIVQVQGDLRHGTHQCTPSGCPG
jgi:hypothetical protein